jgi:translation initiation factor 2B subunit (eIF-2B alpha/beta/delta family)
MDLSHILNDRESGSVALLNRLVGMLEDELQDTGLRWETFRSQLINLRKELHHFAAIENFLAGLVRHTAQPAAFPDEALGFIGAYKSYWRDSIGALTENFLAQCHPQGLTILTHSHSQTLSSLFTQWHLRQIHFRVLQTLSSPGGEGRKSLERMLQLKLQAELIDDAKVNEALLHSDVVMVGCDALLASEFLNKIGTLAILEQARLHNKQTFLITESRKKITRPEWKDQLTAHPLFEWVPLQLIDSLVSERKSGE